ncbi:MAG: tRNA (adenosine(37)-N6)-threonylcarbamoyltransferase complex ATPase subunit type 1 TsaE [Flavobacteriaceae bacterium]
MTLEYGIEELSEVASKVIENSPYKTILFYGNMGVGKTTLIKEIFKQLNVVDSVSSPTFSIVNEYRTSQGLPCYHFDFYRLEQAEEALDIGIDEYFDSGRWCLAEWPENIEEYLPLESVKIHIEQLNNGKRLLTF